MLIKEEKAEKEKKVGPKRKADITLQFSKIIKQKPEEYVRRKPPKRSISFLTKVLNEEIYN